MSLLKNSDLLGNKWYTIFALALSIFILYISLVRASLEIMAKEDNENKLRVISVVIASASGMGNTEQLSYKLPVVHTLPTSPIYNVKEMRDFLWINLSGSPISKSRVVFLIADKKMSESLILEKQNNTKAALDTSQEAIDKLKYADKILAKVEPDNQEAIQMRQHIASAVYTYKKIITSFRGNTDEINQKKIQIIKDIDNWNEEEKAYKKEI